MSAELFGEKLLAELKEDSLASLLSDLRAFHNPRPTIVTGLPALDEIIGNHRFPAAQDRSRFRDTNYHYILDPSSEEDPRNENIYNVDYNEVTTRQLSRPKPVTLNFISAFHEPRAARATLLYHLVGLAVLPQRYAGRNSLVVYIDATDTFSAARLFRVVYSQACRAVTTPDTCPGDMAELRSDVKEALHHVHVIRCLSSRSLLRTLQGLEQYLLDWSGYQASNRKLGLLLIDGINHFHLQDRFSNDLARLEGSTSAADGPPATQLVISAVNSLQATFECPVLYTTSPASANVSALENGTIHPYQRSTLLNLLLSKRSVSQFASTTNLDECIKDKAKREQSLKGTGYVISAWAGGLSAVRANAEIRVFTLKVGDDGGLVVAID